MFEECDYFISLPSLKNYKLKNTKLMKLRFLYFLLLSIATLILFQNHSTGVGANTNQDYTGSPLSSGTCASCHGNSTPVGSTLDLVIKNSSGQVVNNYYMPGEQYTLNFSLGMPAGLAFGMQTTVLNASFGQAGSFGAGSHIINGREYMENSWPVLPPNTITVSWTAPSSGAGNITVYAAGVIANNPTGVTGDYNLPAISKTLVEYAPTSINYAQSTYCTNDSIANVSVTGMNGGYFHATPAGLSINAFTGAVDLTNSMVGQTYVVSYQAFGTTSLDTISIQASDSASFAFTDTVFCLNGGGNPMLPIVGTTTGVYQASSNGLVFTDSTTGAIDLANSTNGTYTVTYTSNGICPTTATTNVNITACNHLESATLNSEEYAVYPNPSNGSFSIENKAGSGLVTIDVFDVLGQVVYQEQDYFEQAEAKLLDLKKLEAGNYWIQLKKNDVLQILKVRIN